MAERACHVVGSATQVGLTQALGATWRITVNEQSEELSPVEIEQAIHGQSTDWYLQKLVFLANDAGWEMGITLLVGGSIVSGILISGKKYFDTFADEFASAWPGEDKEEMRKAFASHGTIYDANEESDQPLPPPQYIHLRSSRVHSPSGNIPSGDGVLWRGKINAVSGFTLGALSSPGGA